MPKVSDAQLEALRWYASAGQRGRKPRADVAARLVTAGLAAADDTVTAAGARAVKLADPWTGIVFREDTHRYLMDTRPVRSVTGLLGDPPAGALQQAGANLIARWAVDHPLEVRELLRGDPGAAYDFLRLLPNRAWRRKAQRGTDVHVATDGYVRGDEVTVPDDIVGELIGVGRFVEATGIVPLTVPDRAGVQRPIAEVSVGNRRHWYAGRLDVMAYLPLVPKRLHDAGLPNPLGIAEDDVWLLDWKTSKAIYGTVSEQTEAYRRCPFLIPDDEDWTWEQPLPRATRTAGVHITLPDPDRPGSASRVRLVPFEQRGNGAWMRFLHKKQVALEAKASEKAPLPEIPLADLDIDLEDTAA